MEMLLQKLLSREKTLKITLCIMLIGFFLVPTVNALTISPDRFDITVEKGKEIERSEYIQISNSANNPIHVYAAVTGPISQFISLEKNEFDLPAGPGSHSGLPRKSEFVKLIISIPREVQESKYSGEITFTEQTTSGGVLGTAVQLGVKVDLNIGSMAKVEFPIYVVAMIVILAILIILVIIKERMRHFNV